MKIGPGNLASEVVDLFPTTERRKGREGMEGSMDREAGLLPHFLARFVLLIAREIYGLNYQSTGASYDQEHA